MRPLRTTTRTGPATVGDDFLRRVNSASLASSSAAAHSAPATWPSAYSSRGRTSIRGDQAGADRASTHRGDGLHGDWSKYRNDPRDLRRRRSAADRPQTGDRAPPRRPANVRILPSRVAITSGSRSCPGVVSIGHRQSDALGQHFDRHRPLRHVLEQFETVRMRTGLGNQGEFRVQRLLQSVDKLSGS